MISFNVLWSIRNELPMPFTIRQLEEMAPVSKISEGFFRFECPYCHEIRATVNPKNNLAHCFCCQKNINNIDLIMAMGHDFKDAVRILKRWMRRYRRENLTV